jgi:hypothetical protein
MSLMSYFLLDTNHHIQTSTQKTPEKDLEQFKITHTMDQRWEHTKTEDITTLYRKQVAF